MEQTASTVELSAEDVRQIVKANAALQDRAAAAMNDFAAERKARQKAEDERDELRRRLGTMQWRETQRASREEVYYAALREVLGAAVRGLHRARSDKQTPDAMVDAIAWTLRMGFMEPEPGQAADEDKG